MLKWFWKKINYRKYLILDKRTINGRTIIFLTPSYKEKEYYLEGFDKFSKYTFYILESLLNKGNMYFIFSFKNVKIFSDLGIAFFVRYQDKLRNIDGEIILTDVNTDIEKVLKLMKLEQFFKIFKNVESAKNYFK